MTREKALWNRGMGISSQVKLRTGSEQRKRFARALFFLSQATDSRALSFAWGHRFALSCVFVRGLVF